MPSLFILVPLFVIMVLNLPIPHIRRFAYPFAIILFLSQIALSVMHYPHLFRAELDGIDRFFRVPYYVDYLSAIMFFCIGIVSLASLAVARHTISEERYRFNFINLLILASIGMCGIVLARDIFSLYVFLEITAVASFILIAIQKELTALEGAFKYIIVSVVATVMMLTSVALILLVAKDTSFESAAAALGTARHAWVTALAIALFLCGLLIKGGIVPFHGWLPDAYMSAPGSVSVLLAGIVTKACGIYTLIRLVTAVFGFTEAVRTILMVAGAASILIGALAAIGQTNFKRMLAYSSVSQVGYIVLGFAAGNGLGIAGAVFHLFNHSIFKTLLFVNAASVEKEAGTGTLEKLGGLAERMPVTGATSIIGSLSACGIPPLAGFWSKLMIVIALWQVGAVGYAAIAVLASALTLGYLLILQRKVFFGKLAAGLEETREPGRGIIAISIILAAISIGAGIAFPLVYTKFIVPLSTVIMSQ